MHHIFGLNVFVFNKESKTKNHKNQQTISDLLVFVKV